MASHHSSHHVRSHHQPCCCCCCCAPSCCQPTPHPGIPSATTTAANDPLLQAIAAHLLQSPPAAPPPPYHLHNYNQQYLKPQHHHARQQQQQKYHHQVWQPELQQQPQAQSLIDSLLRRIAALESALPHLSSPLPRPTAAPERPPRRKPQPSAPVHPANPRLSIRDLAARTIQARFRQYLVRRSQALRHLKHLAAVRSRVAAIALTPSDQARRDRKALYQKATDLLLQLDSIQSTDPMIREGKRSTSRELVRLLELADGVSAKRHDLFPESMEIPHKGIDPLPFAEEPSPGVEGLAGVSTIYCEDDAGGSELRIPPSKAGKRVNFAEDAEASRASAASGMPFSLEEVMERGAVGRAPANGVDAEWGGGGGGGFRHATDDERSPRSRQRPGTIRPVADGSPSAQKGSHLPGLSAPMPLQMEPRKGELKKQKNALLV